MAFCKNCGTQIPDGTKFCPACGTPAASAQPAAQAPAEGSAQESYAPPEGQPQQGGYTPPQQGGYTAPEGQPQQGGYTAPEGQSYQSAGGYTPAQQGYDAGAQQAYAPTPQNAPKEKKPVNKSLFFIIGGVVLVAIIAVVLILVLGGKGGDAAASDDPNLGVYNATKGEMMGYEVAISDIWANGFSIELKAKGKCTLNVDGTKGNGKWTLEDGVFHVSGGGLDCDGTLANGLLTLDNVLDMGVTLTFEKEGYTANTAVVPEGTSAIEEKWDGTWYGCMYVDSATDAYASMDGASYDVYVVVDVNSAGMGAFNVYIGGASEAFASANCEATDTGLYASEGYIAGNLDMNTYNWTFLPVTDYPDQYGMTDMITDDSGTIDFLMSIKKWGVSWQGDADSGASLVPPSIESYEAAIASGEAPSYGEEGAAGTTTPAATGSSAGAEALTGDVDVYNYYDKLYITYPTDTFKIDEEAILDTIAAKDGSVTIGIIVQLNEGDHDSTMEYYDSYSSYDQYSTQDITVAGYEARMITYYDSWYGYCVDVHVNFGDRTGDMYGVNFSMCSEESMEVAMSDEVMAILNTLTVVG